MGACQTLRTAVGLIPTGAINCNSLKSCDSGPSSSKAPLSGTSIRPNTQRLCRRRSGHFARSLPRLVHDLPFQHWRRGAADSASRSFRQSSASLPSLPQWLGLPPRIPLGKEDVAELFSFLRYAEDEMRQGRPGAEEMVDAPHPPVPRRSCYTAGPSPRCRQPEHTRAIQGSFCRRPGSCKALEPSTKSWTVPSSGTSRRPVDIRNPPAPLIPRGISGMSPRRIT